MAVAPPAGVCAAVGASALVFSALYFLSDVIEALQGGFSTGQLWLTLVAEAAIPFFVLGLAFVQWPAIGRLGLVSAAAYAYAFVYFTGTVVYALVEGTSDYEGLSDDLNPWLTLHGAIMVIAGLGFGYAVVRARILPRWSGVALMIGVVAVAATQTAPDGVQLLAAGIRDLGFAAMGASLLTAGSRPARTHAGA